MTDIYIYNIYSRTDWYIVSCTAVVGIIELLHMEEDVEEWVLSRMTRAQQCDKVTESDRRRDDGGSKEEGERFEEPNLSCDVIAALALVFAYGGPLFACSPEIRGYIFHSVINYYLFIYVVLFVHKTQDYNTHTVLCCTSI